MDGIFMNLRLIKYRNQSYTITEFYTKDKLKEK